MERKSVSSSDLSSVGYENGTLEIRFHNGGTYQYYGVPVVVYQALMSANSKGSFFHKHIKNNYRWQKL
ncbi:MAG: KTSC domain-containing protein [Treponema phagedenis]|uniref:KTSC domain-containing protein n=1 Tax=Treponema phagedenis TaxID=162 RepID=UPI0031340BE0